MFNSLFIAGEFTVGKKTDNYYDNKIDEKVFHINIYSKFYQKKVRAEDFLIYYPHESHRHSYG